MPTNKNASIRYQALDKCFSDYHHRYYFDDLIQKCNEALLHFNGVCGVSRRQIFEDIKFMESEAGWKIPLVRKREGKKTFYQYSNPDFSINKQVLTEAETEQLEIAVLILNQFKGMQCCKWIEEVISKLRWQVNQDNEQIKVIGFDQNPQLKGLQFLSPIITAILKKKVIRLSYCSYKENATLHVQTVHPYFVKQYNSRWFLMGMDHDSHLICNFALDRIHFYEEAKEIEYVPNETIDFEHYFDDIVGVTIPEQVKSCIHIVLRLELAQFSYVTSKPLHPSQKIVDEEKRIVSIDVKPNYELDYHILSLGPDIEVLEPSEYREHIMRKLEANLAHYQKQPENF